MTSPNEISKAAGQTPSERWLLLRYDPVALFSLRMTHATNKGGKTLLVPTPYAFKLAMIDACFRREGPDQSETTARTIFDLIKSRTIRFLPPQVCVVQNTFIKIRQAERGAPAGLYVPTIAYREWVFYRGSLVVALQADGLENEEKQLLGDVAAHINHLGKRGCFWQFVDFTEHNAALTGGFTMPHGSSGSFRPDLYGVSQSLDDFGQTLCQSKDGFERVSTYHHKPIKLGQHRILVSTLIPYVRKAATRNFTRYQCDAPRL